MIASANDSFCCQVFFERIVFIDNVPVTDRLCGLVVRVPDC
jgi:hypothetical protein